MTTQTYAEHLEQQVAEHRERLRCNEYDVATLGIFVELARLGGPLPAATGHRDGKPYWTREDVIRWAETAPRFRSRLAYPDPTAPLQRRRASSLNSDSRMCEGVLSSDALVPIFYQGRVVDEVLLPGGAEYGTRVTIFADHDHSTAAAVGYASDLRRDGNQLVGRLTFGRGGRADEIWARIEEGILGSLSVGYERAEVTIVHAGQTAIVAGRQFEASPLTELHVVTKWVLRELSIVGIPADSNCQIREQMMAIQTRNQPHARFAIHSTASVTERPTTGALVSAALQQMGFNDPSQHRNALRFSHETPTRLGPSEQFERDADEGSRLCREPISKLLARALENDGVRLDGHAPAEVANGLHELTKRGIREGSTTDLFTGIAGAQLLAGFENEQDTTAGWCSVSDNLSMRPSPVVAPLPHGSLERTTAGQTAPELSYGFVSEESQLGAYAGRVQVDEQDLINDSLGALADGTTRALGQAAARLRPDLVYSILRANPTMRDGTALFHGDHSNVQTGAGLASDTLAAAKALVRSAKALVTTQDVNGVALNLRVAALIVPAALETLAAEIIQTSELRNPNSAQPPAVVSDARLDNGVTDPATGTRYAGDGTTWFVSTAGVAGLAVQYLAGTNRLPRVRTNISTQGRWGIVFDIRHFVGAVALDWRGLVRSEA
jgi:phage head maturation protease